MTWLSREKDSNSREVGRAAIQMVAFFQQDVDPKAPKQTNLGDQTKWQSPLENMFKINVDATIAIENNVARLEIVIQDHLVNFMTGKSHLVRGCYETYQAEF